MYFCDLSCIEVLRTWLKHTMGTLELSPVSAFLSSPKLPTLRGLCTLLGTMFWITQINVLVNLLKSSH